MVHMGPMGPWAPYARGVHGAHGAHGARGPMGPYCGFLKGLSQGIRALIEFQTLEIQQTISQGLEPFGLIWAHVGPLDLLKFQNCMFLNMYSPAVRSLVHGKLFSKKSGF